MATLATTNVRIVAQFIKVIDKMAISTVPSVKI